MITFEKWFNITEDVQMVMTLQNPIDWASEFWSDSEEFDEVNIPQDIEIILKAYKKEGI